MKRILTLIILAASFCTASAYDALVDGIYYNLDNTNKTAEVTESAQGYYAGAKTIPSSITYQSENYTVTAIGRKAFYQSSTLTSITLPATITRIDEFAFNSCTSLTSITLPEGIDSIGNYAFAHSGITHIIISGDMFAYMPESYSGKYTLPDTIRRICGAAFVSCTGMTGITLPEGLEYIGYSAFGTCSTLASVVIPNSVTYIGGYAFNECYSLSQVTLPENLTAIDMCTFYSCVALSSIDIPATVQSIGRFGFCYCPSLATVKCYATNPPTCGQNTFDQIAEEPTLFVPSGRSAAYRTAAEWSVFNPRIYEMGGVSVDNTQSASVSVIGSCGHIMVQGAQGLSVTVYSADGKMVGSVDCADEYQSVNIAGSGIYFVRLGDGQTKRVVVK